MGGVYIPLSDLRELAGTGVGIGFFVGYPVGKNVTLTGSMALQRFGSKTINGETFSGWFFPMEIGARIYLQPPRQKRFYVAGRFGSYVGSGSFASELGAAVGVGLEVPLSRASQLLIQPDYIFVFADKSTLQYIGLQLGVAFDILD